MKAAPAFACALLAAATSATAASYPVDVESQMNGLDIKVLASSGTPLVITFASQDKADATCTAEIASGFDRPEERRVAVKAGKSAAVPFTLRTQPNRVRVKATCQPSAVKSAVKP